MGILEAATQRMKMEEARYEEQIAAIKAENERLERERDKWEQHACTGDDVLARTRDKLAAAERAIAERAGGRWQVKDYADGWINFDSAEEALAEVAAMGGALIRPLTTEPAAPEERPEADHTDADGYPYEYTRPSEQAVTDEMVEAAQDAWEEADNDTGDLDACWRAALKAAMEAGHHE